MRPKAFSLLTSAFVLALLIACDSVPLKPASNTAEGIFTWAKQFEKEERYIEALEQFGVVKNRFPYSRYAVLAELTMADIHFKRESFIEAQNAYQTFKDLHPRHEKSDYVTYRLALSIYSQLPSTIDRDLSLARRAILYFDEVVSIYPSSEFAKPAAEKLADCRRRLAEKEFYIADYYLKQKQYLSSLKRYQFILQNFSSETHTPRALLGALKSASQLGDKKTASSYREILQKKFPSSSEAGLSKDTQ